jgi:hypothetical protein
MVKINEINRELQQIKGQVSEFESRTRLVVTDDAPKIRAEPNRSASEDAENIPASESPPSCPHSSVPQLSAADASDVNSTEEPLATEEEAGATRETSVAPERQLDPSHPADLDDAERESPIDMQARLSARLSQLSHERNSRWQRLMRQLGVAGSSDQN